MRRYRQAAGTAAASEAAAAGAAAAPDWTLERQLWLAGYGCVAGVDEAGRGALAGPVMAGVVVLPYGSFPFRDSKVLSAGERECLATRVKRDAIAWAVGAAAAAEVDRLNVLAATLLAVERALEGLGCSPDALVTDYLKPGFGGKIRAVARGDQLSLQVAAASILAKTERDAFMARLDASHPGYGFASHKGYGAREHLSALARLGPCPWHRMSFKPVAQCRLF